MTRQPGLELPGATVVGSLAEALVVAGDVPEVCIIGGAEIYRLALPLADTLHLTRVHAVVDADTYFPALDRSSGKRCRARTTPPTSGTPTPMPSWSCARA